jgi:hypothetical protein
VFNASTVLTDTVPAFNLSETLKALDKSSVQTEAANPYSLSLAILSASSSVSNVMTERTGPKISSFAITSFESTLSNIVG